MSDDENKDQHYIMRSNSQEVENENEKSKSPAAVRQRLTWAGRTDKLPDASDKKEVRNGEKSPNQSNPIFLVDNQENAADASSDNLAAILGATSGKKQREELRVRAEEKVDFEELLQAEREKLTQYPQARGGLLPSRTLKPKPKTNRSGSGACP